MHGYLIFYSWKLDWIHKKLVGLVRPGNILLPYIRFFSKQNIECQKNTSRKNHVTNPPKTYQNEDLQSIILYLWLQLTVPENRSAEEVSLVKGLMYLPGCRNSLNTVFPVSYLGQFYTGSLVHMFKILIRCRTGIQPCCQLLNLNSVNEILAKSYFIEFRQNVTWVIFPV